MGDPQFAKYPDLQLAQHVFQLTNPAAAKPAKQASLKTVQDAIKENNMAPLYRYLAHPTEGVLNAPGEGSADQPTSHRRPSANIVSMLATRNSSLDVPLSWDEKLYESLKAENEKELEAIQKEEDEAAEKAGETEVQAARGKRAELYNRIGDKVRCSASSDFWTDTDMHRTKRLLATRPSSRRRASWAPRSTSFSP